jgi:hypothetical protein
MPSRDDVFGSASRIGDWELHRSDSGWRDNPERLRSTERIDERDYPGYPGALHRDWSDFVCDAEEVMANLLLGGLGHCSTACSWESDDRLGGEFLGRCPQGPSVIIEETPIPDWVWWVAAGAAVLFFLKRH